MNGIRFFDIIYIWEEQTYFFPWSLPIYIYILHVIVCDISESCTFAYSSAVNSHIIIWNEIVFKYLRICDNYDKLVNYITECKILHIVLNITT